MNELERQSKNTGIAMQSREVAEIQAAYSVAIARPREEERVCDRILKACRIPAFAESARYSFPRGGKPVEGLSIDAAREMARMWGNMRHGSRVIEKDDEQATVRGWACDLETNTHEEQDRVVRLLVQRKRDGGTQWVKPDERDENEMLGKACALAERNAILHLLPAWLRDASLNQVLDTLVQAAKNDLGAKEKQKNLDRLVASFTKLQISKVDLEKYLGHKIEVITSEEYAKLQGVWKMISKGEMTCEDLFAVKEEPKDEPQDESRPNRQTQSDGDMEP